MEKHWLNHLDKCAPKKYTYADLLKMRYCKLDEVYCYYKDGENGR